MQVDFVKGVPRVVRLHPGAAALNALYLGDEILEINGEHASSGAQFTCFTGTKVQILTRKALQPPLVLNLLALLIQKYKY